MPSSGYYIQSYAQDMAIFQTKAAWIWLAALMAFLLVFPLFADDYILNLANLVGLSIIAALGLNLLIGVTGLISLGHAAFLAIGGYATAIMDNSTGLPFWVILPAAGLLAASIGAIVGIPSMRIKGLYLAITTLAFSYVVEHVIYRWESLTKGDRGMFVSPCMLDTFAFDDYFKFYFLMLVFVIMAAMFAKNVTRSKVGRAFISIRDNYLAAEILGIDVAYFKVLSFAVSSFYAGVAGGLFTYYLSYISPENFTLLVSVEYIAMIIIGGMGSILGSILGPLFVILLPELIRFAFSPLIQSFPQLIHILSDFKIGLYGILLILFLIFEPKGLNGIWQKAKAYWKAWPYSY